MFWSSLDARRNRVYTCIVTQMSNGRNKARAKRARCCGDLEALFEPRFFKALCDPCRIGILSRLARAGGPQTVSEVASCCPTDVSVVSRHLATLRDAGIVEAEKRGKEVYYRVRYPELAATLRAMADAIEGCRPSPGGRKRLRV